MQISPEALESYSTSIDIAATPAHVYELISDITRMGEWSPENVGGEWLDGGSGQVGDWFAGHNQQGEREWTRECEVAVAQPGQDFTFVVLGVEKNCTWWSFEMEPTESGTRLTQRWWFVNKTPAMAGATPEQYAARVSMTPGMIDTTLERFKTVAEG